MGQYNYRDAAAPASTGIWMAGEHERITLQLPEPPSMNTMIDEAKQRRRAGRRMVPVYWIEQQNYKAAARAAIAAQGIRGPLQPWAKWSIVELHFALHNLRDLLELQSSLKHPVDLLHEMGWVKNDAPHQLVDICKPTQLIARGSRGVRLTIQREG